MPPVLSDTTWYAARLKQSLFDFKAGDTVYVRRLRLKNPLAVGPVNVLFSPSRSKLLRVAESYGMHDLLHLLPSNARPILPSAERNAEIDAAYKAMPRPVRVASDKKKFSALG